MPKVTVIIPVHNNWDRTQSCLTSLARHTSDVAVMVADNASTDETEALCPILGQTLFGADFYYLRFPRNCNFGPACNAGVRLCKTDFIFFLSNTIDLSANWLPPLQNAIEANARLAGVGPLVLSPTGLVDHLGICFWPLGQPIGHLYRNLYGTHPLVKKHRHFQALSSAALMLPRKDFLEAGGFFADYVNGMEDLDLCLKLAKGNKYMTCIPESVVFNHEALPHGNIRQGLPYLENEHNMKLLSSRHKLFIHGDLDTLVAQDGYEIKVLPQLELVITVGPEREKELAYRLGTQFRPMRCFDLLEEEPFWAEGYTRLGNFLEAAEEYDSALKVYQQKLSLNLAPSFDDYERIIRITRRLKRDCSSLEEERTTLQEHIQDGAAYHARLDHALYYLRSAGRKDLAQKYTNAAAEATALRHPKKPGVTERY